MKRRTWCLTQMALPLFDNYEDCPVRCEISGRTRLVELSDPWAAFVVMDLPENFGEFTHPFRLLDDDGVVYAYGCSRTDDDDDAFAPLDWGAGWGCTSIEYQNEDGDWEML